MKLHWKIIIGMALGVVFGLIMSQTSFGSDLIKDWIKPFGTIFINLLKLIAMPLILASLVKGISCLLYTSPSPRDGQISRMPSSA